MNTNNEDIDLAIETLERRVVHLSDRVHNPPPGKPPFWRDEAELKALRIAVRAIKSSRVSTDFLPTLANAADSMDEMMEAVSRIGANQEQLAQWRAHSIALDALIDGFDGA